MDEYDTAQKALILNRDPAKYGTIAEIGAGQEVVRWFFHVGGAAGTIAKSMSAYDMTFSNFIYGESSRYVSAERVSQMLDHEYGLLVERLAVTRGDNTTFFAFADTVSARNYQGTNDCNGWMGIRFQTAPKRRPNDIILHVNMTDSANVLQQEALGVFGVNVIYGAFYHSAQPKDFIRGLMDGLSTDRIEVDIIEFSGPDFEEVDHRLLGLELPRLGLTQAVVLDQQGEFIQPSSVIRRRPILIARGSFSGRLDCQLEALNAAREVFSGDSVEHAVKQVSVMELTLSNLTGGDSFSDLQLLEHVSALYGFEYYVMITNFAHNYLLSEYLRRYTAKPIGFAIGVCTLAQLFREKYYETLPGGILEAMGRLLTSRVTLFGFPMTTESYREYLIMAEMDLHEWRLPDEDVVSASNLKVPSRLEHFYAFLLEAGFIVPLTDSKSCGK